MIRYLIMDVDGTLTDGKIYMGSSGEVMKAFSIKDGYAIAHLSEKGIEPVILTGRNSKIVANRAEELSIKRVYQGISDKEQFLKEMIEENSLNAEQIAYIGDDLNDLPLLMRAGLACCTADARSLPKTSGAAARRRRPAYCVSNSVCARAACASR